MSTITPKNIPRVYEDEQKPFREYVYDSLELLETECPDLQKAVLDAKEFEDELYSHRVRPDVVFTSSGVYVRFSWANTIEYLDVEFCGDGRWAYTFHTDRENFSFSGIGHKWKDDYDEDSSPYLFVLHDIVEKWLYLKDEFMHNYEPIFPLAKTPDTIPGYVNIVWITNKYDGPISGYCSLNNRLYYFDMIEETTISQERMYAMYALNSLVRIMAHIKHAHWNIVLWNKLAFKIYWMVFNLKNKYRTWKYGEKYYVVQHEYHKEWCSKHKIAGFFKW